METCSGCWYAEKFVSPETLGQNVYKCRRFPPVPIVVHAALSFAFPLVRATDGCGEHRPPATAIVGS